MMQHLSAIPSMQAAVPQQMDVIISMSNRMSSLEDIIRQQEQVIAATLQRLKELEGVVGTQSRLLEQAQQHISVLSDDRTNSTDSGEKLQAYVQRQSDQINALQAYVQEQMATVHGLDTKYDAVTRGIEQKIQSDVVGCLQRVQGLETSTSDAIRALQGTLQQQMGSIQTSDGRSRDEIQSMQRELQVYLSNVQQQEHQLETTMREALRDVHGKMSLEMKDYVTQLQMALKEAILERNDAIAIVNQRITDEIGGISINGTTEIANLRMRVDEVDASAREGLRTAYTGLAAEVANIAQHSQGVDNRQKLAHQAILQELSKHDAQMETIDVNWRASVVDLNAKLDEHLAGVRNDQRTAAQNFQNQLAGLQDRFAATVDAINAQINDLAQRIHERCIVAIEAIRIDATKQAERFVKLQEDNASTQEYLKKFAADVDRNASQFRQIVEVAIRTAHGDLVDRINAVSAAVALRQEPNEVQQLINNAISKIWEEVNSSFTSHRDLNGLQSQLASLESAVRQEVCALADQDADILKRIDQIEIPMRVLELPTGEIIMLPRAGKGEKVDEPKTDGKAFGSMDAAAYAKAAEESAENAREFMMEVQRIQDELNAMMGGKRGSGSGTGTSTTSTSNTGTTSNGVDSSHSTQTDGDGAGNRPDSGSSSTEQSGGQRGDDDEQSGGNRRGSQEEDDGPGPTGGRRGTRRHRMSDEERDETSDGRYDNNKGNNGGSRGKAGSLYDEGGNQDGDDGGQYGGDDGGQDGVDDGGQYGGDEGYGNTNGDYGDGTAEGEGVSSSTRRRRRRRYHNQEGEHEVVSEEEEISGRGGRYGESSSGGAGHRSGSVRGDGGSTTVKRRSRTGANFEEPTSGRNRHTSVSGGGRGGGGRDTLSASETENLSRSERETRRAREERRERYEQRERTTREELQDPLSLSKSNARRRPNAAPLHSGAFVLKKEYGNFKDFAKEEIDALWIEVMDLNRRKFVTREELKSQISSMKKQLLSHVMNVFHSQESELLGMLSAIKLQLRQITDNPTLMTDVALFRAPNGLVDFERVVEHLNSPQSSQRRNRGARSAESAPPPSGDLFKDSRKKRYHLAPLDSEIRKTGSQHRSSHREETEEVYYVEPESPQGRRPLDMSSEEGDPSEFRNGGGLEGRRPPRAHEIAKVPSEGHPYALTPSYSNGST